MFTLMLFFEDTRYHGYCSHGFLTPMGPSMRLHELLLTTYVLIKSEILNKRKMM